MSAGKMHADEVDTDVALVRRLLAAQFPQWADLPLAPVPSAGTDNAIYRLADALGRIRDYDFPVVLNDVTRAYFERSAALQSGELASAMLGVLKTPPDPAAIALLSRTPFYNSRLRTTCVATMLEGGHAENALPQRARSTVNCRVLPGESIDSVQRTLVTVFGDGQVAISRINNATPSQPSPLTADVLGPIESITEAMWPGVPVIPTMSTGATDGLYLRNAGIPVYGVSGLFYSETFSHGMNERTSAQAFYEGLEFMYRLVKTVAREKAPVS